MLIDNERRRRYRGHVLKVEMIERYVLLSLLAKPKVDPWTKMPSVPIAFAVVSGEDVVVTYVYNDCAERAISSRLRERSDATCNLAHAISQALQAHARIYTAKHAHDGGGKWGNHVQIDVNCM